MKTLNKKFLKVLVDRDLSMNRLAELADLEYRTVWAAVKQGRRPRVDTVKKMLIALNDWNPKKPVCYEDIF